MTTSTKEEVLGALRGWLTPRQLTNISDAIDSGRFDMSRYLSLPADYIFESLDNGGFTKREQYAPGFAN